MSSLSQTNSPPKLTIGCLDFDALGNPLERDRVEQLESKHGLACVSTLQRKANFEAASHAGSMTNLARAPTSRLSFTTGDPTIAGCLGSIQTGLARYPIEVR